MLIWQAHKGKIESAAFAPDGRLLATATGGTRAPYLWEPTTGKLVRKLDGASGTVKSVAFAPHAPLFAAGTDKSVTVWRTDTWAVVGTLKSEYAYELAFGPGPTPAFAASAASPVSVWHLDAVTSAGGPLRSRPGPATHFAGVAAVQFSPDGGLLAMSNPGGAVLWRVDTGKVARTLRSADAATSNRGAVRFSPDGERVAIAYGKWVEVWPVAAAEPGPVVKLAAGTGRSPIVWAVNWTADGNALLTAGNDGCVRVWGAATGAELKTFDWQIGKLYCAAFSPDGLTCAACSANGQVVVWDADV